MMVRRELSKSITKKVINFNYFSILNLIYFACILTINLRLYDIIANFCNGYVNLILFGLHGGVVTN